MQKLFIFALIVILLRGQCFAAPKKPADSLHSSQIIIVLANNWDSVQATLYAYEKQYGRWVLKFTHPVVVGAKGLGVGDGVTAINIPNAPVKKEGDLKAPAGIFSIGAAFGYSPMAGAGFIKNVYIQATDTVICVDDAHSIYYNRIISADTAHKDWNSFEHMRLTKNYYKWGLFVNHNAPLTTPGHGSCIFIHIWGNANEGTEGCTAMTEDNLLKLLHWVDAAKKPLLVQLPAGEYANIARKFGLPDVKH